jgi:DNA-binding NtrC family response regulator
VEAVTVAEHVGPEPTHDIDDIALASRYAATTVLITAKDAGAVEQLARRVHAASARARFPLLRVAAATLPIDTAVLAETCGGLLDGARGGCLLLSDVEYLPATVQAALIDTFAELQAARAPDDRVRLMAGTTTSLYERIADSSFCARLFYRLNLIHLIVDNDPARRSAASSA